MVDSERTCTTSGAAGDAWADADAGLAGGTESDVTACSEMIGDIRQFWDVEIREYEILLEKQDNSCIGHLLNKYNTLRCLCRNHKAGGELRTEKGARGWARTEH
jgi:hypothetical protein